MCESTQYKTNIEIQPDNPSVLYFCQFINQFLQDSDDPLKTVLMCEAQAEAVRLRRQDVNFETIDLLLDTVLNVLHYMGTKWTETEQRRRTHRLKTLFRVTVLTLKRRLRPGSRASGNQKETRHVPAFESVIESG